MSPFQYFYFKLLRGTWPPPPWKKAPTCWCWIQWLTRFSSRLSQFICSFWLCALLFPKNKNLVQTFRPVQHGMRTTGRSILIKVCDYKTKGVVAWFLIKSRVKTFMSILNNKLWNTITKKIVLNKKKHLVQHQKTFNIRSE